MCILAHCFSSDSVDVLQVAFNLIPSGNVCSMQCFIVLWTSFRDKNGILLIFMGFSGTTREAMDIKDWSNVS